MEKGYQCYNCYKKIIIKKIALKIREMRENKFSFSKRICGLLLLGLKIISMKSISGINFKYIYKLSYGLKFHMCLVNKLLETLKLKA